MLRIAHFLTVFVAFAGLHVGAEEKRAPKLGEAAAIINDSNSFLKNREPAMTAEEYELYDKVVGLLTTRPALAVTLLEGMSKGNQEISPAFDFILGNAYAAAGQDEKARARYESAVGRYPDFLRAWDNLGLSYYTKGDYPRAEKCFSKALSLGDNSATTFGLQGYCLEQLKFWVGAETAYLNAVARDLKDTEWQEGLMRVYLHEGQIAPAKSLAWELVRKNPQLARYWTGYADVLLREQKKPEALAILEMARALRQLDDFGRTLLADLYAELAFFPEAIATYAKLPVAEGTGRLLNLARAQLGSGALDDADMALDAAARVENGTGVKLVRAEIQAARKNWPASRASAEEILISEPLNGMALMLAGRAYWESDDSLRAALTFERASEIKGFSYAALVELANLELQNRHYAKSASYAQRALLLEYTPALEQFLRQVKALLPNSHSLP